MKRKLLTILICCILAITLAFSLASCGDNQDNKETQSTESTNSTENTDNTDNTDNTENKETDKKSKCELNGHTYDNACDVACNECNQIRAARHDYSVIQNDETYHWYACSVCERVDGENKSKHGYDNDCDPSCNTCGKIRVTEHTGGTATCTHGKLCEVCGVEYDTAKNSDNHVFIDGVCACGLIDAIEMTAEQLNAAVLTKLAAGETDIEIILAPDAPGGMFTAIRRALIDTEGVADGSINLTLKGVTEIPDHSDDFATEGSVIFGAVFQDENGQYLDELEIVTQLASVNLPDVLTIGERAFQDCKNLTAVTAPKVQTIGYRTFSHTALVSVEFPEATTIYLGAFISCQMLTSVKLPKATSIGNQVFLVSENMTYLELTAEGNITLGESVFSIPSQNFSDKVDLVLNFDKKNEVTNGNTWNGYTFKTITFTCLDGTTNHDYQYTDNGDRTHDAVCSKCGYVKADNEKHTAIPDGYDCICGATVIAVIDGTLGGKTEATEEDLTAMVKLLRSYIENGTTTIIVTGSQPAKLLKDGYLTPVVSLAFEQLTYAYQDENIDSYWGTVDLIYQDVTEIVEYEFYVCDVLKSITLPKVTTVGDRGFWACYYLETLKFGSVVTNITDNSGEVFYDLGYKIDGCNLVLNRDQVAADTDYQPDLVTNTWWNTEWKSITLE